MRADGRFLNQPPEFWANVRTIGQEVGYTERGRIKVPSLAAVHLQFAKLELQTGHLVDATGALTVLGEALFGYFKHRAAVLNDLVQHWLMDKDAAEVEFERLRSQLQPRCPLPMNKQKGEKRNHAFLTGQGCLTLIT